METAQEELRRALPKDCVRWTKSDQFHLTLRFLGAVPAGRFAALVHSVQAACQGFSPLSLRAERIGFFPDARFPRVVWIGVQDARNQLPRLQRAVETAAGDFTLEKSEDKFTGHVTLGRIKGIKRAEAERLAKLTHGLAGRFLGEWGADKVEVMRSELLPGGARHTTLADAPLAGEPAGGKAHE